MKKPLIILTGPTAIGKTSLSIALAKKINGEIISADSMQVYQKMNIGTAKIMPDQMSGIKHYLIDEIDPKEEFNVVRFQELANTYIQMIYEKKKIPIVVGGTGFYIQALLYGIQFEKNKEDSAFRQSLQELAKTKGEQYLHDMLEQVDEESAKQIHPNNIKRVIRALEYYHQTKTKISSHNERERKRTSPFEFLYFVLTDDRTILYENINKRVDQMIEQGLLEEVQSLQREGYHKNLVSMQGIGYKEMLSYLEGAYSLEETIFMIKQATRHFAKRQLTWFRREQEVIWVDKQLFQHSEEEVLQYMLSCIKKKETERGHHLC